MNPKFPPELARIALERAEADAQTDCIKHWYTQPQLAEIERRIWSVRERRPAGDENKIPAEITAE